MVPNLNLLGMYSCSWSPLPPSMASIAISLLKFVLLLLSTSITILPVHSLPPPCSYTSIFSFGDSFTDTGNMAYSAGNRAVFLPNGPPYGMTYFNHPTGRCSDGRLIVDFLAQGMGLPFLPPSLRAGYVRQGANFAMAGATALNNGFLKKMGIHTAWTNNSLSIQIEWFKHRFLPHLCPHASKTKTCNFLDTSLIILGEIGGNDYYFSFSSGKKLEEIQRFVLDIISIISSSVQDLIEHGARTVMVPGNIPIGCNPALLTYFSVSAKEEDYDASTGCINWLNAFSEYHNQLLQDELDRLRRRYPYANIIYADYYNAAMSIYNNPRRFGFSKTLEVCCGIGDGRYNYNSSAECGSPESRTCVDPSKYVSWDGVHMTEAAYKIIAAGLLKGLYTSPGRLELGGSCPGLGATSTYEAQHQST